jgi:hypothetical protein
LATNFAIETGHKRRTKTKKKRGNSANKGACKESGTEKKVPTWGTRSKVNLKNPEAKIPNEDLSSRTNPRVEFEKNFRRVAFGRSRKQQDRPCERPLQPQNSKNL